MAPGILLVLALVKNLEYTDFMRTVATFTCFCLQGKKNILLTKKVKYLQNPQKFGLVIIWPGCDTLCDTVRHSQEDAYCIF